jgi:hypothetical protein
LKHKRINKMDLQSLFGGRPAQLQSISPFDPRQLQAMERLRQSGLDILANPSAGFEPIAQQARTRFGQQTVPMLAERFLGSGQNLASSGLTQQLGQAGAGLEEALAAMQAQYGMQNRAQGMQAIGMGLQPQYQFFQTPEQQGLLGQLLPLALQAGLGYLTGGGAGSIMSGLSGLFSKSTQPSGSSVPLGFPSRAGSALSAMQYGGVPSLYNPSFNT